MKRIVVALAMVAALGGCSIFRGRGDNRPKTAVLGERIPVLTTASDSAVDPALADRALAEVSVATYSNASHLRDHVKAASWNAVTSTAATTRMFGSASVDLAGVATGRIGVFLQANLHPWDWYPGAALVIGAGGVAEEVLIADQRWLVAGNAQAVAEARQALLDAAAALA